MFEPLPDRLDLLRDAAQGRAFRGRVSLNRMERLREAAAVADGDVEVELVLDRDETGILYLEGSARASVSMTCQRCLELVELPLHVEFSLGLVQGEREAERLPEQYEPLQAAREPVAVAAVIEDELLLALPVVPRHEACSMGFQPRMVEAPEEVGEEEPARENPFAALSALKGDGSKR